MQILHRVIILLLVLLSLAAGAAKVLGAEEEVAFLQSFGLNSSLIVAFGLLQIAGAVCFAVPKTRNMGGLVLLSAFLLSSVLIFMSGNFAFAGVSCLPIVLIIVVMWLSTKLKLQEIQSD